MFFQRKEFFLEQFTVSNVILMLCQDFQCRFCSSFWSNVHCCSGIWSWLQSQISFLQTFMASFYSVTGWPMIPSRINCTKIQKWVKIVGDAIGGTVFTRWSTLLAQRQEIGTWNADSSLFKSLRAWKTRECKLKCLHILRISESPLDETFIWLHSCWTPFYDFGDMVINQIRTWTTNKRYTFWNWYGDPVV